MHACMHACMHTYTNKQTNKQTYIHTYIHTSSKCPFRPISRTPPPPTPPPHCHRERVQRPPETSGHDSDPPPPPPSKTHYYTGAMISGPGTFHKYHALILSDSPTCDDRQIAWTTRETRSTDQAHHETLLCPRTMIFSIHRLSCPTTGYFWQ